MRTRGVKAPRPLQRLNLLGASGDHITPEDARTDWTSPRDLPGLRHHPTIGRTTIDLLPFVVDAFTIAAFEASATPHVAPGTSGQFDTVQTRTGRRECYVVDVPARVVVDEAVPAERHPSIVEAVRAALKGKSDDAALIAVVTRLPSGRLQVFVNHVEDPAFVSALEAALAQL